MLMAGLGIDFGDEEPLPQPSPIRRPPPPSQTSYTSSRPQQQPQQVRRKLAPTAKTLPAVPPPQDGDYIASSPGSTSGSSSTSSIMRQPGHPPSRRPSQPALSTRAGRLTSPQRRVRIVSRAHIVGHGAGHTTDEDIYDSPEIGSDGASSFSSPPMASDHHIIQGVVDPRIRSQLGTLSVVNRGESYESTASSASSFAVSPVDYRSDSAVGPVSQPKPILRRAGSQPDLTSMQSNKPSLPTPVPAPATRNVQLPAPPVASTMARSQSSTNLPTTSNTGASLSTASSLGRSSEVKGRPQRKARAMSTMEGLRSGFSVDLYSGEAKRQSWHGGPPVAEKPADTSESKPLPATKLTRSSTSATNKTDATTILLATPSSIHETPNQHGMVPDGFGGWIEPDRMGATTDEEEEPAVEEDGEATPVQSSPVKFNSNSIVEQRRASEPQPQQEKPRTLPVSEQQQQMTRPPGHVRGGSDAGSMHSSASQTTSYTVGSIVTASMRPGSYYNADGSEYCDETRSSSSYGSSDTASSVGSDCSRGSRAPTAALMTTSKSSESAATPSQRSSPSKSQALELPQMHSSRFLKGLEAAERGEGMVSLDPTSGSFQAGPAIVPGDVAVADQDDLEDLVEAVEDDSKTERSWSSHVEEDQEEEPVAMPAQTSTRPTPHGRSRSEVGTLSSSGSASQLDRHGTLINTAANPARRSRDLQRLLGNNRKAPSSVAADDDKSLSTSPKKRQGLQRSNASGSTAVPPAVLEKGKQGKARVEVDLLLESDLVVEGGMLRGRLEIQIRKPQWDQVPVLIACPKVRVVGFEELLNDDTRHVFYHHATVIDGEDQVGGSQSFVLHGSPNLSDPATEGRRSLPCFAGQPDQEGYSLGREGSHSVPFSLEVPIGRGAKGSYRGRNALVRYIVIGSVKLKDVNGDNRSIAHFYRHVELYPYLNPAVVLSSAPRPISAEGEKGLFMGGSGKVRVAASLHRGTWVAGQRVYINVGVTNETSKRVKNVTFTLIRTVTLYRPRADLDLGRSSEDVDPDACETTTSRKKVTEESLEMGQKGGKGIVTARGWWTGVEAGSHLDFSHHLAIPADALTIARGRHVDVSFMVRVSVGGSMSSDVIVELPLKIINFMSLDPPPNRGPVVNKLTGSNSMSASSRSWIHGPPPLSRTQSSVSAEEAVAMVRSAEALRSPGSLEISRGPQANLPSAPPSALMSLSQRAAERKQGGGSGSGNSLQAPEDPHRQLQHRKSLDFINHAIRSATARRLSANKDDLPRQEVAPAPAAASLPMGLGIDISDGNITESATEDEEESTPTGSTVSSFSSSSRGIERSYNTAASSSHASSRRSGRTSRDGKRIPPSCVPYEHIDVPAPSFGFPFVQLPAAAVSVDEDEYDSDEEAAANQTLGLNQDSMAEVDMVVGSTHADGTTEGEESISFDDADNSTDTVRLGEDGEDDSIGEDLALPREGENARPAIVVIDSPARGLGRGTRESTPVDSVPPPRRVLPVPPVAATARKSISNNILPVKAAIDPSLKQRVSNSNLRRQSIVASVANAADAKTSGTTERPASPTKQQPTNTLRTKSSFTFATNAAPLRLAKTTSSTPAKVATSPIKSRETGGTRAKAAPQQFADAPINLDETPTPSPRKSRPLPKEPVVMTIAAPPSSKSKTLTVARERRVEREEDSDSPSSADEEALTPVSVQAELGVTADLDAASNGLKNLTLSTEDEAAPPFSKQVLYARSLATPPRVLRHHSAEDATAITPPIRSSLPPRSISTNALCDEAMDTNSTTTTPTKDDRFGGGMPRSNSSQNVLRGSTVVVPSVRNKIALLESRQEALRDFTRPTGGNSSPLSTPPRVGGVASAIRANLTPTGVSSSSSPTSALARRDSTISLTPSEASSMLPGGKVTAPWLRRDSMSSMMSFKAPVLRPS